MSLLTLTNRKKRWPFLLLAVLGVVSIGSVLAQPSKTEQILGRANFVITDNPGSELQLEVWQMPMAKALKTIAKKTKVPIHYSVLPEGLVTATCVDSKLKPVLDCLLAGKADLIVRYPRKQADTDKGRQIVEAWVLGFRLDNTTAKDYPIQKLTDESPTANNDIQQEADKVSPERAEELLKLTQSSNAAERAQAIGELLAAEEGNPDVKAALEYALTDQDPIVRSQAVSSYANREGKEANDIIQDALSDSSVDVRMMAVDAIKDDKYLLQQAINDSDETIRSVAQMKLDQLIQTRNQNQ